MMVIAYFGEGEEAEAESLKNLLMFLGILYGERCGLGPNMVPDDSIDSLRCKR